MTDALIDLGIVALIGGVCLIIRKDRYTGVYIALPGFISLVFGILLSSL